MNFEKKLFFGHVGHTRKSPKVNQFVYPIFYISLPLSSFKDSNSILFSLNSWNILSLWEKDYGSRGKESLETWVRNILKENKLSTANGEIILQTLPRVLGYVFNPISFWLCYSDKHELKAVICEVNNTFGETHHYLVAHQDGRTISEKELLSSKKVFFVSPFFNVSGDYKFSFQISDSKCKIDIDYFCNQSIILETFIFGNYHSWSKWNLLKIIFFYPISTILVTVRIHWQAMRLWVLGVSTQEKPDPPKGKVSR